MISPVIHFNGNCSEAIKLYEQAFSVSFKDIHYYKDAPENNSMAITEDMLNLVMHSTIEMCGTRFNMSDVSEDVITGDMVCFNVFVKSESEILRAYDELKKEGNIVQDIGPQFFARLYTVVIDKFGIRWQVMLI